MKVNKIEHNVYIKEDATIGIKKKILTPIPQKVEGVLSGIKMESFERDLNAGEITAKNLWDKKENCSSVLNFELGFTQHELEQSPEVFAKMFDEAVEALKYLALVHNEYYIANKSKK